MNFYSLSSCKEVLHFGAAPSKNSRAGGSSPSPRDWFIVADLPELQLSVIAPGTSIACQSHTFRLGMTTCKAVRAGLRVPGAEGEQRGGGSPDAQNFAN